MRLPELQARPQRAERPSLATVSPSDLGLGAVAQDVAAWEGEVQQTRDLEMEAQRVEDEKTVEPFVQDLQTRFEDQFANKGAEWDGITPDFARGIQNDFEAYAGPVLNRPDLTPGQRDALSRGVAQYREATGQRAIQYQAQRRGQQAAEQAAARDAVAIGGIMATYTEQFGAAKAQRDASYDGSSPDYTTGVLADHDRIAAEVIAAAPEALRPRVTQSLQTQRLTLMGQAMDFEARGEQAYIAGQTRAAGEALVNGVLSAPSLYEQSLATIDQTVAALPAAQRGEARAGLMNDVTEAYVTGLIRDGQHDQALSVLNGGTLDTRLKPDTKARLLGQATTASEALTIDDALSRYQLQQDIDDDLASRMETGVGLEGLDLNRVAEELGPQAAAKYLTDRDRADAARSSIMGLQQMTEAQMRDRLQAMRPEPGQPGYDGAQQTYEWTARAIEREIAARDADGAAWAVGQSPQLRTWLGGIGAADDASQSANARHFAGNVIRAQAAVGIPPSEQRVLPKGSADAIIAAVDRNADRSSGLRGLGDIINAFGPRPGDTPVQAEATLAQRWRVMNELEQAGADKGDIAAAVTFATSPVLMGRYVAAQRSGAREALTPGERDRLEASVDREMGQFRRSHAIGRTARTLLDGQDIMVERLAAAAMSAGTPANRAARDAARNVTDAYVFIGPNSIRVPRAVAARRTGFRLDGGDAASDINRAMAAERSRLLADDGAGLSVPQGWGSEMTEAQRRRRWADSMAQTSRWVTAPDDSGVILVRPNLDNQFTALTDRSGSAIYRTWAQMIGAGAGAATARAPRATAAPASGAAPRGSRNSNPGNMRPNGDQWLGMRGIDNGPGGPFIQFETPMHGARAMAVDLSTKFASGLDSVEEIVTVWAPRRDGNNTGAYVGAVSRALGVDPRARLNLADPEQLARLMSAMSDHENGPGRFTLDLMRQGVQARSQRR